MYKPCESSDKLPISWCRISEPSSERASQFREPTLPETNSWHLKIGRKPKRKPEKVFQPSIFRCYRYVSSREPIFFGASSSTRRASFCMWVKPLKLHQRSDTRRWWAGNWIKDFSRDYLESVMIVYILPSFSWLVVSKHFLFYPGPWGDGAMLLTLFKWVVQPPTSILLVFGYFKEITALLVSWRFGSYLVETVGSN